MIPYKQLSLKDIFTDCQEQFEHQQAYRIRTVSHLKSPVDRKSTRLESIYQDWKGMAADHSRKLIILFPLFLYCVLRRLRNATSRINTAFFVTYKQITPHRIWYNRVD